MDQAEEKKPVTRVGCHQPNGLLIRLYRNDDLQGLVQEGPAFRLNGPDGSAGGAGNPVPPGLEPGVTEVDSEWWGKWVEQNKGKNPLLDEGHVFALDEKTDPAENPT